MDTREKLNEFAELRGWNKNKPIGWSEAADFGDWLVKNCSIHDVSGSVDLTGINSTNSTAIIGNTTTDTTMMKAGWYSDNFSTYYLDDNGVKHYR